jgi:hypothetical protein
MNAEIILLAIGCYLFCGIEEKIYRLKTGDWKTGTIDYDFQKELSEFAFIPNETMYEEVVKKFREKKWQRTHRVIRKQKYNGNTYYFNRELSYVYREVKKTDTRVGIKYCSSDLELALFFLNDKLVFYNVYDMRVNESDCSEYVGKFHTLTDTKWLAGGENDNSSPNNCNKKFYRIFTLGHFEEWDKAWDCDFKKDFKNYWSDPVYSDRQYVTKDTGWPCGGIFNSC